MFDIAYFLGRRMPVARCDRCSQITLWPRVFHAPSKTVICRRCGGEHADSGEMDTVFNEVNEELNKWGRERGL